VRVSDWPYIIPLRIRSLLLRDRVEQELDEELQFHFDQQVEAGLARGMTPGDAHTAAGKALGSIQLRKEECRDMRGLNFIDSLGQDLRYAVRVLRKSPGFTFAAIFALALGIGVNTAVFTAYKAMIARPLDARDPGRMVDLAVVRQTGVPESAFSYPDYEVYRDSVHSFSGLIAFSNDNVALSHAGGTVSQHSSGSGSRLLGLLPSVASNTEFAAIFLVSENYFKVLGVGPVTGRTFESIRPADLAASPSVLISENFWQRRFARDSAIVGKTVHLNGAAFTIVGITPHDFVGTGIFVPDFWVPMSLKPLLHPDDKTLHDRENQCCRLFGRLAPGFTIRRVEAEITLLTEHLRGLHDPRSEPAQPGKALVWPGSPFPLPLRSYGGLQLAILLTMTAAAMAMVVACANVGSLQLARARARQTELRTRLSLGASRRRIIRQLLTESALLGLLAGAAAYLFTWALLKVSVAMAADALPVEYGTLVYDVAPNLELFAYVFAVSQLAGLLFGLAPALESSRAALVSAVRADTSPVRSRRLQDLLIAAQVALSLVLLIAGGMLIHSAVRSLNADPGYDSKRLLRLDFQFPEGAKYTPAREEALTGELLTSLRALPGVASVTSARGPNEPGFSTAAVPGGGQESILHYTFIQADYFRTVGIPLFLGRGFQGQPGPSERSVVLSESAAQKIWPRQNPIGRGLRLGPTDGRAHSRSELSALGPAYVVVGVARDTRGVTFDGSDSAQIYLPLPAEQLPSYPFLIRAQSGTEPVIREIGPTISSIDPDLIATLTTIEQALRLAPPVAASSLAAAVASGIGLIGLLLASMGIYGTVSYIVVLRTREVGIRRAVGAKKRDILGLILREITRPVVAGLLAGMVLAVGVSYLLRGLLHGLDTVDSVSFAGVSLSFLAIALVAAYPPARRAIRVDPNVALRYE
jgi:macrolide transport system ATP-binding/permease protein